MHKIFKERPRIALKNIANTQGIYSRNGIYRLSRTYCICNDHYIHARSYVSSRYDI